MKIFVFGSNLAGIHGAGAALYAAKHKGAKYGLGLGLQGNAYALPTKDRKLQTLPLFRIIDYIEEFKAFAAKNPDKEFQVTRVGCGLAGYDDEAIAPHFIGSPSNCYFDSYWSRYLGDDYEYWGTY